MHMSHAGCAYVSKLPMSWPLGQTYRNSHDPALRRLCITHKDNAKQTSYCAQQLDKPEAELYPSCCLNFCFCVWRQRLVMGLWRHHHITIRMAIEVDERSFLFRFGDGALGGRYPRCSSDSLRIEIGVWIGDLAARGWVVEVWGVACTHCEREKVAMDRNTNE